MAVDAASTSPPASLTVLENRDASAVVICSFSARSLTLSPAATALLIRAVRPNPPPSTTAAVLNLLIRFPTVAVVPVTASVNPDTGFGEKVLSISFFVARSSFRRPELSAPIFTINAEITDISLTP